MANEISVTSALSVAKTELAMSRSGTKQFDLTAAVPAMSPGIIEVGTSHEALDLGDVAGAGGFCWFQNLGPTNYVELGVDVSATFYPLVRLYPGQATVFALGTTAPYARANSAAVRMEALILDA